MEFEPGASGCKACVFPGPMGIYGGPGQKQGDVDWKRCLGPNGRKAAVETIRQERKARSTQRGAEGSWGN